MAERLQRTRRAHRTQFKKLVNQFTDAVQLNDLSGSSSILINIQKKFQFLEQLDTEIAGTLDSNDDEFENILMENDDYLNELNSEVHKCERTFNALSLSDRRPDVSSHAVSDRRDTRVQLPKVTIPKFNGNILDWPTFWGLFESSIHSSKELSEIDKFTYLKSFLIDEAESCISGIPLTDKNYSNAIELLSTRFGQPHRIIDAYVKVLIGLDKPSTDVYSIRHFSDKLEATIRTLNSLGKPENTYETMLLPILWDKLPAELQRHFARSHGNNEWTLELFRNQLQLEISILESCSSAADSTSHTTYMYEPPHEYRETGTITSLHTGASRSKNTSSNVSRRSCVFCKGSHFPSDCLKYKDIDSRISFIKTSNLCFNCLGQHKIHQCKSLKRCLVCKQKHHTSIHKEKRDNRERPLRDSTQPKENTVVATTTTCTNRQILLKTAVATVHSDSEQVTGHILFDDGSQRSFITNSLVNELGLVPVRNETLNLSTFGGDASQRRQLDVVQFKISGNNSLTTVEALVVPSITKPVLVPVNCRQLPEFRHLTLAHPLNYDIDQFHISILIGSDHYYSFVRNDIIRSSLGPIAVDSSLGYLICGPSTDINDSDSTSMLHVLTEPDNSQLQQFWSLETIGITPITEEPEFVKTYCQDYITFQDGRYEAKLPWSLNHEPLPTNMEISHYRTRSMIRRLATQPDKFQTYNKIIQDQLNRDFIEKVPDSELCTPDKVIHYLPHHPVMKDSTTTPLRIVFDCSCSQKEMPSLNDCLESGPPLLNDIIDILLRFRLGSFALSTDIEKAFLNIGLHSCDRDATRFFWLSDPNDPESDFQTFRFKRILFGATCSPFILNSTLLHHLKCQCPSQTASEIQSNIYVDNILTSFDSENELSSFVHKAESIMNSAGFKLRSWASNSIKFQQTGLMDSTCNHVKLLGLIWNVDEDTLSLNQNPITEEPSVTKRVILQQISKIFDPLGILSPVTISARVLIQDIWKDPHNYEWDTPLPEPYCIRWLQIAEDVNKSIELTIPRQYNICENLPTDNKIATLHVFADASCRAYGTSCYLQTSSKSSFVIAKSRVAPTKTLTIPKLELMAATIAARLGFRVFNCLSDRFQNLTLKFWTDSTIVLNWLKSTKKLPVFVQNRVNEIKTLTLPHSWNYCSSSSNPADLLTRGISFSEFVKSDIWFHGNPVESQFEDSNVSVNFAPINNELIDSTALPVQKPNILNIITTEHFSSMKRLVRVTAWILRFVNNLRKQNDKKYGSLDICELDASKTCLIVGTQHMYYQSVFRELSESKPKTPIIAQLQLFIGSQQVIRCRGRLHNAPLEDSTKFPILLPKDHHFTKLLVLDIHATIKHSGVNSTITSIRSTYWIPQVRQLVKSLLSRCVVCRRLTSRPYKLPNPPPLPESRVAEVPPFHFTGVDFCGPLMVSQNRKIEKCYVCLFTCAVTRAIHLELTTGLSTDSFLNALRRFASRRSLPNRLISDNASTFTSANLSIKDLFDSPDFTDKLSTLGLRWQFITKRAPWQGGFYERLIGVTKLSLKKVLHRSTVSFEELRTLLTEIEANINNRPLLYTSEDLIDGDSLTPAHFLHGRITTLPHPCVYEDELTDPSFDLKPDDLRRRVRLRAALMHKFQHRWKHEYLTSLREFHRFCLNDPCNSPKVGSVVQIHDDNVKRLQWKLGVVTKLVKGKDGYVRSVLLKTANGFTNRPVSKLFPLEVYCDSPQVLSPVTPLSQPSNDNVILRPKRAAAQRAIDKIHSYFQDND